MKIWRSFLQLDDAYEAFSEARRSLGKNFDFILDHFAASVHSNKDFAKIDVEGRRSVKIRAAKAKLQKLIDTISAGEKARHPDKVLRLSIIEVCWETMVKMRRRSKKWATVRERDELALTDTIGNFVCRSCTNSFRKALTRLSEQPCRQTIEFGALTSLKPTTEANDLKNYEKANRLMPSLRYKDPQRYTQEILSCIRYNGEKDKDGQSDYLKI
ncbi:unnamed protein product, partial [Mesorhabditis spiculigera]